MALLPFLFKAEEFYPLQPEDAQAEESLRMNPSYAPMYRNIAEEHYKLADAPDQVEPDSVVTDYSEWLAACRSIDEQVTEAHRRWKEACNHRDEQIIRLKRECEELRFEYQKMKRVNKPPQPRSARKG